MIHKAFLIAVLLGASSALAPVHAADSKPTASPAGAKVYFIAPANGATVSSPVVVQFGLKGMGVAPAGVDMEGTGHHHVIVDRDAPPLTDYLPVGEDKVLHFGKGQTEAEIKLPPGKHTLQLVFGDKDHRPHQPPVISEKITITVK